MYIFVIWGGIAKLSSRSYKTLIFATLFLTRGKRYFVSVFALQLRELEYFFHVPEGYCSLFSCEPSLHIF